MRTANQHIILVKFQKLKFCKTVILVILFTLLQLSYVRSQAPEKPFELTSSDSKKLEKADKLLLKSDDKNKEAEIIYTEVSTEQDKLSTADIEKKNNKALQCQVDAILIKKDALDIKYEVYQKRIDEYLRNNNLNQTTIDRCAGLLSEAKLKRESSEGMFNEAKEEKDLLMKYSKVTSAIELSSQAIDGLIKIADILTNPPAPEFVSVPDTILAVKQDTIAPAPQVTPGFTEPAKTDTKSDNVYQAVKINKEMLDRFNNFLQNTYPSEYEKFLVDFSAMSFSDLDAMRNAWYKYLYGENYVVPEDSVKLLEPDSVKSEQIALLDQIKQDSIAKADSAKLAMAAAENITKSVSAKNKKGKGAKKTPVIPETKVLSDGDESAGYKNKRRDAIAGEQLGFTYRVQIVACRVPMRKYMLDEVYKGTEIPEERYENEWYQYSIGPFASFNDAVTFRESCGVKDAFILMYVNGKQVLSWEKKDPLNSAKIDPVIEKFSNLTFKVQVAASRNKLNDEELRQIYANIEKLEVSEEDGWFKYLINCGNYYADACEMLKQVNVKGAFVVTYKDGNRIKPLP